MTFDVIVDVIEPLIVAALVNGNDTVGVIDAVDSSQATTRMLSKIDQPGRQGEAIRPTVSFPFTSAATIKGPITITTTSIQGKA